MASPHRLARRYPAIGKHGHGCLCPHATFSSALERKD